MGREGAGVKGTREKMREKPEDWLPCFLHELKHIATEHETLIYSRRVSVCLSSNGHVIQLTSLVY